MRNKLAVGSTVLLLLAVIGGLVAPAALSAGDRARIVRWDLPHFVSAVIVAGGEDVSVDATTGDTMTLTGSGHVEPRIGLSFGGGTFVHETQSGTPVADGAFYVTDLIRWRPIEGGSLAGTGLTDGIADIDTASSGILRLAVTFVPQLNGEPGTPIEGILTIFCKLPGTTFDITEGVRVRIPSAGLDFVQHSDPAIAGVTLFHIVR